MAEINNVIALKKLCAKIIGGDAVYTDIPGDTVAEVIDEITKSYEGATPETLGSLTVTSAPGSTTGKTKITVVGASSSPYFRYKVGNSSLTLPERNASLADWTEWNGVSEIEAEDSATICVCETDIEGNALKGGLATVSSLI